MILGEGKPFQAATHEEWRAKDPQNYLRVKLAAMALYEYGASIFPASQLEASGLASGRTKKAAYNTSADDITEFRTGQLNDWQSQLKLADNLSFYEALLERNIARAGQLSLVTRKIVARPAEHSRSVFKYSPAEERRPLLLDESGIVSIDAQGPTAMLDCLNQAQTIFERIREVVPRRPAVPVLRLVPDSTVVFHTVNGEGRQIHEESGSAPALALVQPEYAPAIA